MGNLISVKMGFGCLHHPGLQHRLPGKVGYYAEGIFSGQADGKITVLGKESERATGG